ncbi:LigB subunit of an aromatic-ring-opening dioxygenase LigAB [Microstroma glucosiphilum]|uniref:LigB subunit of an aromatic-ring-opening dioxygenase LigAB n=1 Tax=Pseudomicrostroma glucosiphilum TaxID=1684307 RepID=A0A316U6M4_9BASI|nr:LigB subunit of an aromatic-ring-opening dioxygenase LigAB [Pseudomicrostroma glucosiphilum]PWN20896.1 LigB subunit of an aromatic-ring-opening dioxygenase LigAB [Pseudomicrostroma glucosiphilum]
MPTAVGPSSSTLTAPASSSAPANPGRLPVFFFSHGTTAMMGEQSEPAAYWEEVGRRAIECGVERLVFQGAHWHPDTPDFLVATNPKPPKQPVAWVEPSKYVNFEVDIDVPFSEHIIETLNAQGISAKAAPDFEIIHDTLLILRWMFPKGRSLPMSIISTNGFFDPHKNLAVGTALSHLRDEKCLLIGSGGAVHNLYRLNYTQVIFHKDNFAQEKEPEQWAIDFGQAVTDAIKRYSGPKLRRALVSLMDSPQYRDAHGTDDHYLPILFSAGAATGSERDLRQPNHVGAECWELRNMRNTQYQFGRWPQTPYFTDLPKRAAS